MSSFTQWRESVIKDNPICRNCGEKTTDKNQSMIIIGTENKDKILQPQWYSQHKECDLPRPKWSKQKDS